MEKIVVTGASGFVGKALVDRLSSDSKQQIIGLYHNNRPSKISGVTWLKVDLLTDNLSDFLADVSVVYHLAAHAVPGLSKVDIAKYQTLNVEVTKKLLASCVENKVSQFVFVSSVAAGEFSKSRIKNETNGYPITPYGKSKKQCENILQSKAAKKITVTILRPTALYGENHLGSFCELVNRINRKRFFYILSSCIYRILLMF